MSYKIRRIARSRDKRAEIMLHEVIVQSDVLPLHAETHRITGTDPILPSDIGAETPAGAQTKADAAEARAKAYTDQEVGEVSQALDVHKAAVAPHSGHATTTALDNHVNNKNNPHNVTAEQVGAPTQAAFDAHVTNINNRIGTLQHQAAILKPEGGKLWHFDTSLESTDGIKPLEGAVATLRPNEGRFGGAVAVEEATTNLLKDVANFTTGSWSRMNVDVTSLEYNGMPGARFTPTGAGSAYAWVGQTFLSSGAAGRTFTWSFYARGQTARTFHVNFYGGVDGTFRGYVIQLTTEWRRYSITHTFPATATSGRIQWGNVTPYWGIAYLDWIEVAGVQVEEKPFPTSFVDGTRSDGLLPYPVSLSDNYTISCYRKASGEDEWKHVAIRSDGKVFVDEVEDSSYNTDWIQIEQGKITFTKNTGLLDELLILPYAATEEEIKGWYEAKKPFIEANYQPAIAFPTAGRPLDVPVGFMGFDTDLGLPIWWNGTDWIDASGNIV